MDAFEEKSLAVYEAGMRRLASLSPDLYAHLRSLEPIAFTPYRAGTCVGLAAAWDDCVALNVETWSTLSPDEAAFTLAHEATHILDDQDHDPKEKENATLRNRSNVARDITINDRLIRRGLPQPEMPTLPTGPSLVGRDCSEMAWRDVLDLLPEQIPSDPGYYLRRLVIEIDRATVELDI